MNSFNFIKSIALVALVWMAVSCCEPCEKENLGQFTLKEEVKDWLEFANRAESFKNENNRVVVINYGALENDFLPQLDDCNEVNRCGLCCSEFEAEFQRVIGADNNVEFQFEFVVIKDFFNYSPSEGNANIAEYLQIRVNNQGLFDCRIEDLANAELTDVVTLNGTTFANVFKCEIVPGTLVIGDNQVTGMYFTKDKGLVGWRLNNGQVFSLI